MLSILFILSKSFLLRNNSGILGIPFNRDDGMLALFRDVNAAPGNLRPFGICMLGLRC